MPASLLIGDVRVDVVARDVVRARRAGQSMAVMGGHRTSRGSEAMTTISRFVPLRKDGRVRVNRTGGRCCCEGSRSACGLAVLKLPNSQLRPSPSNSTLGLF